MPYQFIDIAESNEMRMQAAKLLMNTFIDKGGSAWPDMPSAMKEVDECIEDPNICIGICEGGTLIGWCGLRPMYERHGNYIPWWSELKTKEKGLAKN